MIKNVKVIIPDDDLACEDLLIGLSVLRNFKANTRTIIDKKLHQIDGTDCCNVRHSSVDKNLGSVGSIIIERINRCTKESITEADPLQRINYHIASNNDKLFYSS